MFFGDGKSVILKGEHVGLDGFTDVGHRLLPALALRNTARKTRALSHPKTVFSRVYEHLSHERMLPRVSKNSTEMIGDF